MVTTQELRDWFLAHRDWCMDLVRIYLGVGLLAKGIAFLAHRDELLQTMVDHHIIWSGAMLAHWVILTHIFGGLLMAMGIGTRVGALIQIPTLVGDANESHHVYYLRVTRRLYLQKLRELGDATYLDQVSIWYADPWQVLAEAAGMRLSGWDQEAKPSPPAVGRRPPDSL